MTKKKIINHILSNGGKLQKDETWLSIAILYGILPANKKRAQKDQAYSNKAIARQAQRYWQGYVKQESKLALV